MTNHEILTDFYPKKTHLRIAEIAARLKPPSPRIMNANVLANMINGRQTTPDWVIEQLGELK